MQRAFREGNFLAFRKQKSESVGDWCNRKDILSAYFPHDSVILKCKQSFRPVLRSVNTASIKILSNATLTLIVVSDVTVLSHLNFIFTI